MDEDEFAELAAGHALGALGPEDERRYGEALAAHPAWARIAEADASTVAALAEDASDIAPPPSMRETLLSQIATLPQGTRPADESVPTRRRRWTSRAWFALAASLALVAALGVGTTLAVQSITRSPAAIALEQIEAAPDAQSQQTSVDGGGTATLHWSTSLGTAVLVTEGLPALSDRESFEMWIIREDTPAPAGVFASGDRTTALIDGSMRPGDTFAVTIEPAGGSPTGQPTTDPILAITTS